MSEPVETLILVLTAVLLALVGILCLVLWASPKPETGPARVEYLIADADNTWHLYTCTVPDASLAFDWTSRILESIEGRDAVLVAVYSIGTNLAAHDFTDGALCQRP